MFARNVSAFPHYEYDDDSFKPMPIRVEKRPHGVRIPCLGHITRVVQLLVLISRLLNIPCDHCRYPRPQ